MSRLRIALFNDWAAAESVLHRLRREGIPAELHDELRLARLWFVTKLTAGVRLEVPVRSAETALRRLLAWDAAENLLHDAIRCPECRSLLVDFPQFTQKSFLTNLVVGFFAELGLVEKAYYCEACHYTWPRARHGPAKLRKHAAPDYFIEDCPRTEDQGLEREPIDPKSSELREAGVPERLACLPIKPLPGWVRRPGPIFLCLLAGAAGAHSAAQPAQASMERVVFAGGGATQPDSAPTYLRDVLPILMGKCARCHSSGNGILQNWLDYQQAFADRREIERRVWHSWRGGYFKQPMPTGNSPESLAISDEERRTIKQWVEDGAPRGVAPSYGGVQSKAQRVEAGRRLFGTICAACHQPTAQGIPGRFPPLAGSDFLNGDKHRAIGVLVNGLQGDVVVNGQRFNNSMPKFPLGDYDIANVLTFVYSSFGNSGKEVTPQEVAAVRAQGEQNPGGGGSAAATAAQAAPREKSPWE